MSKRTKKSLEVKFSPFTCQNKACYSWLIPLFGVIEAIIGLLLPPASVILRFDTTWADCCRSAIPELNVRQRLLKRNISDRWASQLVNLPGAQMRVSHCLRSIGMPQ